MTMPGGSSVNRQAVKARPLSHLRSEGGCGPSYE